MSAAPQLDETFALEQIEANPELQAAIIAEAWEQGELAWKCRPYQREAYAALLEWCEDRSVLKACLNVCRRWGKTTLLCLVALRQGILFPGSRIRFAAPTLDELRERLLPIFEQLLADCPEHLRPVWRAQRKAYVFANGSRIYLAGVNNQGANKLRGSGAELCIVDEGGFIDELRRLIFDVLTPQLTDTDGTLLMGSTPPESGAHDYVGIARECKANGNYYHADVYTMGWSAEKIEGYAIDAGGYESPTWEREYLAKFVTDPELVVIPDFRESLHVRPVPMEREYPFWQKYVGMDIGATRRDWTAVVFAHWHFLHRRCYVERVLIDRKLPRLRSPQLAKAIRDQERELWGEHVAPVRWSDNNSVELLVELGTDPDHPVLFRPTSKDQLPAMVQNLRDWFSRGWLIISDHPSCVPLVDCLRDGTWKGDEWIGREFARSTGLGHLDALAALIYLVRNIDERQPSPIPENWGLAPDTVRLRRESDEQNLLEQWYGNPARMDS